MSDTAEPSGEQTTEALAARWRRTGREIVNGSILTSLLAVVIALVVGAILIALSNAGVQSAFGYFFARPGASLAAIGRAVGNAYSALFNGAILNIKGGYSVGTVLKPLTDTLTQATPLIIGGLGLGIGFRAGLFNIGGQGQIIVGGIACAWVSFAWNLPAGLHVIVAVVAAIVGGALWGFIPGILRATVGANEVITTIMLNYVALNLVAYLLTFRAWQAVSGQPQSPPALANSRFPYLFGSGNSTDWGFVLALLVAVGVWWLMERSTLGFRLRAIGANPDAATTAGIKTARGYMWCLVIGGALLGLVAATQLLGADSKQILNSDIAGTFGFDAITVALLGRNRPLGTVLAGLLFGALKAGGYAMQLYTPIDVVLVLEAVIVLFIAAPPLVRTIFRLPDPERRPSKRQRRRAAARPAEQTVEVTA